MSHDDSASGRLADAAARRLPWVIFVATSIVFLLTASYVGGSGDVVTSNLASWQLATGSRPYLDQFTYPALDAHPGRDVWVVLDASGREIIGRAGGPVLLAVPAYAVSAWVFGVDSFSLVPGAMTAAVVSGASVALFASAVRPWLGTKNTALAALVLSIGTPVWSVSSNAVWPQTVTVLGVCGMAWAASRGHWWLVGLFGGVAVWGRIQAALIVAVVGLVLGLAHRSWTIVTRVACASGALLVLLLGWSRWMYGYWNPTAYYNPADLARYQPDGYWDPVNQLGSWISPDRGILVWTPLLLVLLPTLARHWRQVPLWSRALACAGVAYTVLEATLIEFPGGDSFYGYRMTLELLVCLAPAVSIAALHLGRVERMLFAPLVAIQAVAIAAGAVNESLGLPKDVVWRQNSFVVAAFDKPLVGIAFLVVSVALGVLGQRIWRDPGLRTTSDSPLVDSTRP